MNEIIDIKATSYNRWTFTKRSDGKFGGWVNCICGNGIVTITADFVKINLNSQVRCPRCSRRHNAFQKLSAVGEAERLRLLLAAIASSIKAGGSKG